MAKLFLDPTSALVRYDPTPEDQRATAAREIPSLMLQFIAVAEPVVLDKLREARERGEYQLPFIALIARLRADREQYEKCL